MQKTIDLSLENAALKAKLTQISEALSSIAGSELQYMACELTVIAEHPSVEEFGTVAGALAALGGRLGNLMEQLALLAGEAQEAAGIGASDVTSD